MVPVRVLLALLAAAAAFAVAGCGGGDTASSPASSVRRRPPDDGGKLEKLLAKGDQPGATADVEGWTAAAETKAALDTYRSALDKGLLVDVDAFARALEGLPAEGP